MLQEPVTQLKAAAGVPLPDDEEEEEEEVAAQEQAQEPSDLERASILSSCYASPSHACALTHTATESKEESVKKPLPAFSETPVGDR